MEKKLSEKIKQFALTKRLNFLIGSGASYPAIKLMNMIEESEDKTRNVILKEHIIEVSTEIITKNELQEDSFNTLQVYNRFIATLIDLLYLSNSRQTPKNINIFTTNYDLFLEKACDEILKEYRFILNDGTSGYFNRVLDSSNFNRSVAYRGLNDNYTNEIPSITIIKPHGSVNWEKVDDEIYVRDSVIDDPCVVEPTGYESQSTFLNNHFHDMLRIFQIELDKQQSVLYVLGFSFQDSHIAKMTKRALMNPEIIVVCFAFDEHDKVNIKNNLGSFSNRSNLHILTYDDFKEGDNSSAEIDGTFTLTNLVDVLSFHSIGNDIND